MVKVVLYRQIAGLVRASVGAQASYRSSFVQEIASSIAYQSVQLVFLGVVLAALNSVGGWSSAEVVFLFGLRACSHSVYTVFFWEINSIDARIRSGFFDHALHRPLSPYLQLLFGGFTVATLGDCLLGIGSIATGIGLLGGLTVGQWIALPFLVLSGGLVEAGVATLIASFSFVFGRTESARHLAETTANDLAGIPLSVFGPGPIGLAICSLPVAFIAYLPAALLLNKITVLPRELVIGSPLVGPAFFALSVVVFHVMLRFYDGASGTD